MSDTQPSKLRSGTRFFKFVMRAESGFYITSNYYTHAGAASEREKAQFVAIVANDYLDINITMDDECNCSVAALGPGHPNRLMDMPVIFNDKST